MNNGWIKYLILALIALVILVFFHNYQERQNNQKEPVACTMDAKMCPDGSFVGRISPTCEFAKCPGE